MLVVSEYFNIFSCVKMNVFRSFFLLFFSLAFRVEMHVRCDNQYKTGADGGGGGVGGDCFGTADAA